MVNINLGERGIYQDFSAPVHVTNLSDGQGVQLGAIQVLCGAFSSSSYDKRSFFSSVGISSKGEQDKPGTMSFLWPHGENDLRERDSQEESRGKTWNHRGLSPRGMAQSSGQRMGYIS